MPSPATPHLRNLGDTAFSVEFGTAITPEANARVTSLAEAVERAGLPGVIETIPSFRALMVRYDPLATTQADLAPQILALLDNATETNATGRRWALPVCYDDDLAPDLAEVASLTGFSRDTVIDRHLAGRYAVYMLGFMPGFAYMGGLDPALHLPRLAEPRVAVPAGSVAIAGELAAIYPWNSPGGWRLIGHCPVPLFDLAWPAPALLAPGDLVRFTAIGRAEHDALAADPCDPVKLREAP